MRFRRLIILGLIGYSLVPLAGSALDAATQQHIQELQNQISALEAQAQQYRSGIAAQQDKAQTLQRDISILQNQISQLQAQLNANGKKIELTQTKIADTEGKISVTTQNIDQKRETVGRMILYLEQADHEDIVASLFKYPELSSFLQQFHDLASVQDQLLGTIKDLKTAKADLESARDDLQTQRTELQTINEQVAQQQQQVLSVKNQKNQILKDTKGQEALYQKQLTAVEKRQAAFFKEEQQLEAQAIAGGLYIVHVTASGIPPRGTKLFQKPEDAPHLTQGYGFTAYARRGAYGGLQHNGIDLATGYGTPLKAAGDGTIIAHGTNDGWGNWVAIQHPNNLVTLYGHMSRFENLPVGTAVSTGQIIGYEGNTGNVTGSHVHLSVYREFFTYANEKNGQLYFNYDKTLNPLDYL